jgi:hypothetical protein
MGVLFFPRYARIAYFLSIQYSSEFLAIGVAIVVLTFLKISVDWLISVRTRTLAVIPVVGTVRSPEGKGRAFGAPGNLKERGAITVAIQTFHKTLRSS